MASKVADTCANCGRIIGPLETPHLFNERIVCIDCIGKINRSAAAPAPPAFAPTRLALVANHSASAGITGIYAASRGNPVPVAVQHTISRQEPRINEGHEKDIWNANPSLWIGFRTYFWCVFMSLLCIVAAVFSKLALLLILLFVGVAALRVIRIKAIHYHLTSQRLRITSGILSRKIIEIELFRIRDLSFEQGFVQRLLSVGTVKAISTDEDAKEILLRGIKDPMKVKENLRRFVMASRQATGTRDVDMSMVR